MWHWPPNVCKNHNPCVTHFKFCVIHVIFKTCSMVNVCSLLMFCECEAKVVILWFLARGTYDLKRPVCLDSPWGFACLTTISRNFHETHKAIKKVCLSLSDTFGKKAKCYAFFYFRKLAKSYAILFFFTAKAQCLCTLWFKNRNIKMKYTYTMNSFVLSLSTNFSEVPSINRDTKFFKIKFSPHLFQGPVSKDDSSFL